MLIFGSRASNIGNFDIPNTHCGYCQKENTQQISVFGKYAHIFWIPIFPFGKKAVAECAHCKRTIEQKEFSEDLKKKYFAHKKDTKRPIWHWLGLLIVGALFALTMIIGVTAEEDPRDEFLKQDISSLDYLPSMESDSFSYKLKQMFDVVIEEDMEPSEFQYRTIVKEDKALVLVKMPKLRKVVKDERHLIIEMVELVLSDEKDLKDKDLYIGVMGQVLMKVIKTPTYQESKSLALKSELLDFYGPKE